MGKRKPKRVPNKQHAAAMESRGSVNATVPISLPRSPLMPPPADNVHDLDSPGPRPIVALVASDPASVPPASIVPDGRISGIVSTHFSPTVTSPGQRRDLLSFVNSLYAGAISLGIARFMLLLHPTDASKNPDSWTRTIPAFYTLIVAVCVVLDDWRHARWVNEDYGYRLNPKSGSYRYWLDCGIAICSFFFISSSFVSPIQYLFWLGCMLLLGWVWALRCQYEICEWVHLHGSFPPNSLGLTIDEATKIAERKGRVIAKASSDGARVVDYRVAFVPVSHLLFGGALVFSSTAIWVSSVLLEGKPGESHRSHTLFAVLEGVTKYAALGGAAAVTLFLISSKVVYHYLRKNWLAQRDKILEGIAKP